MSCGYVVSLLNSKSNSVFNGLIINSFFFHKFAFSVKVYGKLVFNLYFNISAPFQKVNIFPLHMTSFR